MTCGDEQAAAIRYEAGPWGGVGVDHGRPDERPFTRDYVSTTMYAIEKPGSGHIERDPASPVPLRRRDDRKWRSSCWCGEEPGDPRGEN